MKHFIQLLFLFAVFAVAFVGCASDLKSLLKEGIEELRDKKGEDLKEDMEDKVEKHQKDYKDKNLEKDYHNRDKQSSRKNYNDKHYYDNYEEDFYQKDFFEEQEEYPKQHKNFEEDEYFYF